MMPTRSIILRSEIHILINSIWQRKELFSGGEYLRFIDIREVTTRIITITNNTYYFYQIRTTFKTISLNEKLSVYVECVAGFHQCVCFDIAAQTCVYLQTQGDKCECSGIIFYSYL